jgi:hypothetical protein
LRATRATRAIRRLATLAIVMTSTVSLGARFAAAQTPAAPRAPAPSGFGVVRVSVADERGQPVANARVDFSAGPGGPTLTAFTDSAGRRSVRLATTSGRYEYLVRRIGFAEGTGSFALAAHASIDVAVTLKRAAQQLEAVQTSARENRLSYSITAEQIASSGRHDIDAYNILHGMRPNMMGDRMRNCPYTQYFWINGHRIPLAPWEAVVPLQSAHVRVPMPHSPPNSPLTMIRPQHIAEMHYVNCLDQTVPNTPFHHNALFVTLKAGVGFDLKHGSYVADSTVARAAGVIP